MTREPTVTELLESIGTPTASVAAKKVERQEKHLREARSILSDIIWAYAEGASWEPPESLGQALEAGRQHILYCGFREMPYEPFTATPEDTPRGEGG